MNPEFETNEKFPVCMNFYENGNIKNEYFVKFGNFYRKDGLASKSYYENGKIKSEDYYLIKEFSPNYIEYDENGFVITKKYYSTKKNEPGMIFY
jgi:antitoxin component YwqK of YwqJK toxin-antitoxin module